MSIFLSLLPLFLRFVLNLSLSFAFFLSFPTLYFPFFQASSKSTFQIEAVIDMPLDLSFLDQTTFALSPQCVLVMAQMWLMLPLL